jgi:hypothetical protein
MEAIFVQTPFFFTNIKRYRRVVQSEITRHGKTKNDKDETENVLLDLICFLPVNNLAQKRGIVWPGHEQK